MVKFLSCVAAGGQLVSCRAATGHGHPTPMSLFPGLLRVVAGRGVFDTAESARQAASAAPTGAASGGCVCLSTLSILAGRRRRSRQAQTLSSRAPDFLKTREEIFCPCELTCMH